MKPFDIDKIPKVTETVTVVFRDGKTGRAWRAPDGRLFAEHGGQARPHHETGHYVSYRECPQDIIGIYEPPITRWVLYTPNGSVLAMYDSYEKAYTHMTKWKSEIPIGTRLVKFVEASTP